MPTCMEPITQKTLLHFQPQLGAYRFFLLFGSGLFAIFGFRAAGVAGAGALGCLIIAFIAGIGWKKRGWPDEPVYRRKKHTFIDFG